MRPSYLKHGDPYTSKTTSVLNQGPGRWWGFWLVEFVLPSNTIFASLVRGASGCVGWIWHGTTLVYHGDNMQQQPLFFSRFYLLWIAYSGVMFENIVGILFPTSSQIYEPSAIIRSWQIDSCMYIVQGWGWVVVVVWWCGVLLLVVCVCVCVCVWVDNVHVAVKFDGRYFVAIQILLKIAAIYYAYDTTVVLTTVGCAIFCRDVITRK